MELVSSKIDSGIHRVWTQVEQTDMPWTFYIAPGWFVREKSGDLWANTYPVIGHFWPGAMYQVFVLLKPDTTDYYCNLIAPPIWSSEQRAVTFYDLDLDVWVDSNGVKLLDMEEYESRKHLYGDPWNRGVAQGSERLMRWAASRVGPFSEASASRWRAWVRHRTLQ